MIARYLVYARAPFLTAVAMPVLLGSVLAWAHGKFDILLFVVTLAGSLFAHAGVNLANDYFDFVQGADPANKNRTPFNGGSPHLSEGTAAPATIRALFVLSFALAAACGLWLMIAVDGGAGPVLYTALAGFVGGYFYTAPPFKFVYRGMGEAFVFVCFGPLPAFGAWWVQTKEWSWLPAAASVPVAFLITNILYLSQFNDAESDAFAGKRTLVVRLGKSAARWGYYAILAAAYASLAWLCADGTFGLWGAAGFLSLPLAVAAVRTIHARYAEPTALIPAMQATIGLQLLVGVLLTAGVVLRAVFSA